MNTNSKRGSGIDFCSFFFSSRRRHTRYIGDWSSDVCSSDLRIVRVDDADNVVDDKRDDKAQGISREQAHQEAQECRSEERRVGKECRNRGKRKQEKKRRKVSQQEDLN